MSSPCRHCRHHWQNSKPYGRGLRLRALILLWYDGVGTNDSKVRHILAYEKRKHLIKKDWGDGGLRNFTLVNQTKNLVLGQIRIVNMLGQTTNMGQRQSHSLITQAIECSVSLILHVDSPQCSGLTFNKLHLLRQAHSSIILTDVWEIIIQALLRCRT